MPTAKAPPSEPPATGPLPARELVALREVGRTAISRPAAALLAAAFLMTVLGVPAVEAARALLAASGNRPLGGSLGAFEPLAAAARAGAGAGGFFAANHQLLRGIAAFEERLEARSWMRERLLPPVQAAAARWLGLGNEQVYLGRSSPAGRWLFYRADVDAVTGPPFLAPRVLAGRMRAGDAWEEAPAPDPRPAIVALERDLAARGIDLLVVPVPVKPAIHPEALSRRYAGGAAPVENPSAAALAADLAAAGVALFDPGPVLAALARREPAYLVADTHWSPAGLEAAARALARRVAAQRPLPAANAGYTRRRVAVDGLGDLAAMLRLPSGQTLVRRQRVEPWLVLDAAGRPWRPEPAADILLLGDSFTNVYSDPALGWGASAGLAEQLSYHLRRPFDRIAQSAGGAHAAREALRREVGAGRDRLAGKRLVVYQFATRELAQGDWHLAPLPPAR